MSLRPDDTEPRHPIQVVARRTGLSADVLRAWERRFGVVQPGRSEAGRRRYSDADIARLALLRAVTREGWSIGQVAHLPNADLRELTGAAPAPVPPPRGVAPSVAQFVTDALDAVRRYDATALDTLLWRAVVTLSPADFFDRVLTPLLTQIGTRWREGELRPASEHIATAVIRRILGRIADAVDSSDAARRVVVGTPAGQLHDIGALLVAASAAGEGWGVTYLGADLPAEDVAAAARRTGACLVALSVIHPADDPNLPAELRRLRDRLPPEVEVVIGGSAAGAYAAALRASGAKLLPDLDAFRAHLRGVAEKRADKTA